jgi:antirestriction protein ArdC
MVGNDKAQAAMAATVAQLVELMEQGAGAWRMPWNTAGDAWRPSNPVTGRRYTGGNRVHLALMAMMAGRSSHWATYKQWQEIGAQVRRGERSTPILRPIFRKVIDEATGEECERLVSWATVPVFSSDQVDGWAPAVVEPLSDERNDRGEQFVAALVAGGLELVHGGDRACYSPSADRVTVPTFEQFTSSAGYYSTVLHECTHWTGHESRLNRLARLARFGDDAYAAEELVAELGAAFLCCELGIESEARRDHAAYLASWIRVLKADPRHLWTVASKAEDATTFLTRVADAVLPADERGAGSPSEESVPSGAERSPVVA